MNKRHDRPITQKDEIHSVKCLAIDETQILIEQSIHELQIEIDSKIPDTGKTAYLLSQLTVKRRTFVNSKEFRLRFLRSELFDVQKSAIRMLKWLDKAYDLFGSVVLERPIRLSADFTSNEQKVFRKGYVQLMPVRAFGTGRRILCIIPYDEGWYTISTQVLLKMMMYTSWVIGNDIDTQRKGAVLISMFDSSFPQKPTLEAPLLPSDQWTLSVRMSAMHICTPDTPISRLRRSLIIMALGSDLRSRLKLHAGTSIEHRYILQNYGIPIEFIPITYTGKIKLKYVRQWLRLRNMIEDQEKLIATNSNASNIIITEAPYLNDVLFKPGVSFTSHPGNITLHNLIESKVKQLHEMENSKSSTRKELVSEIMDEMQHKYESRFLYWHQCGHMSDCWWVLLHPDGITNDQKVVFNRIEPIFRKQYSKKQQQGEVIRTKYIDKQQALILHQSNMATDAHNENSNNNEKKRKITECNNNDTRQRSLTFIDSAITRKTTSSTSATTIKQNGGTYIFHSLDGKHNNSQELFSLHPHDTINGNDGSNSTTSSECFGMKFVPCND